MGGDGGGQERGGGERRGRDERSKIGRDEVRATLRRVSASCISNVIKGVAMGVQRSLGVHCRLRGIKIPKIVV